MDIIFTFFLRKYFAIDFFTFFLTSSDSQSYKDLTEAVSLWLILRIICFSITFCHICIFSYFFQKFSLLTFICFSTHCMLYTINVYSVLLIQRRMVSQMGFPSRFLYPNTHHHSQRLQNATEDIVFFVFLPTWLESSASLSVAYICQFEYPRLPWNIHSFILKSLVESCNL